MDIEDGEENADSAKLPEAERGVFRFVDTDHFAVGGADKGEWIGRRGTFRIPEEEEQANEEEGSQEHSNHPPHPPREAEESGGADEERSCFT